MIPAIRQRYNSEFSEEKYRQFLLDLEAENGMEIPFRIAETPTFISRELKDKILDVGSYIIEFIQQPDFKALTERAIPANWKVPNENTHPHFIALDFGICEDGNGGLSPMLIEMQGFPSLFGFQELDGRMLKKHFYCPPNFDYFFNGLNHDTYYDLLKRLLIGDHDIKHVVLMDIKPEEQKTGIDFVIMQNKLGIRPVDYTEIVQEGNQLFYFLRGEKIRIKRIYNRLIFDELETHPEWKGFDVTLDLDVEWITHPNWFYRISEPVEHRFMHSFHGFMCLEYAESCCMSFTNLTYSILAA